MGRLNAGQAERRAPRGRRQSSSAELLVQLGSRPDSFCTRARWTVKGHWRGGGGGPGSLRRSGESPSLGARTPCSFRAPRTLRSASVSLSGPTGPAPERPGDGGGGQRTWGRREPAQRHLQMEVSVRWTQPGLVAWGRTGSDVAVGPRVTGRWPSACHVHEQTPAHWNTHR